MVIFWDEFVSNHRDIFEASLRIFNGTIHYIYVTAGDFQQIPPVVKNGNKEEKASAEKKIELYQDITTQMLEQAKAVDEADMDLRGKKEIDFKIREIKLLQERNKLSEEEAERAIKGLEYAEKLEKKAEALTEIAARSKGTPRILNARLKWYKDYIMFNGLTDNIDDVFMAQGIDSNGLDVCGSKSVSPRSNAFEYNSDVLRWSGIYLNAFPLFSTASKHNSIVFSSSGTNCNASPFTLTASKQNGGVFCFSGRCFNARALLLIASKQKDGSFINNSPVHLIAYALN